MVGFCSIDVEKTTKCKYISLFITIRYTKKSFWTYVWTEECDISLSYMVIGQLEKKLGHYYV